MSESAFLELIGRVRAGDEQAAAELVKRYEPAIRRAARVRLVDPRLRRLFDSMDISQAVFASFFVRAALGQYELAKPQHLLRLLVDMSRKKLADHVREDQAARRDYRRVRSGNHDEEKRLVSDEPDPGQQASMTELLHQFRRRLSEEELDLAGLRASGWEWEQIGKERSESAEALRKKLTRAIDRVARELKLDGYSDE